MKKWDKKRILAIAFLCLCIVIGFSIAKPIIEKKVLEIVNAELKKIEEIEEAHISRIRFGFFPPKVSIKKIDLKIKNVPEVRDIQIDQVAVYPTIINLLSGQLRIRTIRVSGADLEIFENKTDEDKPLPKYDYAFLRKLPFVKFEVLNSKIRYSEFTINARYLVFKKTWNGIDVSAFGIDAKDSTDVIPNMLLKSCKIDLSPNSISVGNFTLSSQNSYLQFGLNLNKPFSTEMLNLESFKESESNLTTKIQLQDFENIVQRFVKKKNNKDHAMKGTLQASIYSQKTKSKDPAFAVNTLWKDIQFDSYAVKNLEIQGLFENDIFNISKLSVDDNNLAADSSNLKFKVDLKKKTLSTDGNIHVRKIEVGSFLENNLLLENIPVYAPINAVLNCNGELYPNTQANCKVKGNLNNVKIWSSSTNRSDSKIIVDLTANEFDTNVTLYKDHIDFKTNHQFNESHATGEGSVDYVKGFDVRYNSDFFSFNDIRSLANIPLKGFGKISGTTRGSAKWGVFDAKAELSDFHFFDYYLGESKADVSYANGNLNFTNGEVKINSSLVNIETGLNFDNSNIYVLAKSDKAFVQDILAAIKNIAEVPIYLSGDGSFDLNLKGPLNLGQMTYKLTANFDNGLIHKDRYKNLKIDVEADEGQVKVNNSVFYLSDQFNLTGTVNPKGMVDLVAIADSVNLANIIFFKDLGLNLDGLASIRIDLKDHILLPEVTGQTVTKTMNTVTKLGDSSFNFKVHKTFSEFDGSFFDGKANGHFMIPHNETAPISAKANYSNFNPLELLSIFNNKTSVTNAKISFTGSSDLHSKGDIRKNLSGSIKINQLSIGQDNVSQLTTSQSSELKLRNGKIDGQISLKDNINNKLDFIFDKDSNYNTLKGRLNLTFLRAFVPNLNESRGQMSIDTKFNIFPEFEMYGKGSIRNLYVKIENLKHPFQNINTNFDLKKTTFTFNDLNGEFANGLIQGAGFVDLKNSIKVNFAGKADRLNLDIPEDVKSVASGNFFFTGDGFPYKLGGNFKLHDGFFGMEFAGQDDGKYSVVTSQYIPSAQREKQPLDLDLKIETENPIKVKNSMVDGMAKANIRIQGGPSTPILTGTVDIMPNTSLISPQGSVIFKTTAGQVTFNTVTPSLGQLNINAETRIRDNNEILGKDYDVQVIIQGYANDPTLTFSSQPSLNESEILSLIALGVKDSNRLGQEISSNSQQSQTGYQLGGIFLKNEFARDLQDRLGVQVNFTSSFEDQDVSPKISIEKKFSPKFSITGSRTLGTNKRTATKAEYKFNKNFSIISGWENNDIEDATLLRTRRYLQPNIIGVDVQYSFEFE